MNWWIIAAAALWLVVTIIEDVRSARKRAEREASHLELAIRTERAACATLLDELAEVYPDERLVRRILEQAADMVRMRGGSQ